MLQRHEELHADFFVRQQAWLELEEGTPDPQEEVKLNEKRKELADSLKVLKAQADEYDRIPFFRDSLAEKAQKQKDLEQEKKAFWSS